MRFRPVSINYLVDARSASHPAPMLCKPLACLLVQPVQEEDRLVIEEPPPISIERIEGDSDFEGSFPYDDDDEDRAPNYRVAAVQEITIDAPTPVRKQQSSFVKASQMAPKESLVKKSIGRQLTALLRQRLQWVLYFSQRRKRIGSAPTWKQPVLPQESSVIPLVLWQIVKSIQSLAKNKAASPAVVRKFLLSPSVSNLCRPMLATPLDLLKIPRRSNSKTDRQFSRLTIDTPMTAPFSEDLSGSFDSAPEQVILSVTKDPCVCLTSPEGSQPVNKRLAFELLSSTEKSCSNAIDGDALAKHPSDGSRNFHPTESVLLKSNKKLSPSLQYDDLIPQPEVSGKPLPGERKRPRHNDDRWQEHSQLVRDSNGESTTDNPEPDATHKSLVGLTKDAIPGSISQHEDRYDRDSIEESHGALQSTALSIQRHDDRHSYSARGNTADKYVQNKPKRAKQEPRALSPASLEQLAAYEDDEFPVNDDDRVLDPAEYSPQKTNLKLEHDAGSKEKRKHKKSKKSKKKKKKKRSKQDKGIHQSTKKREHESLTPTRPGQASRISPYTNHESGSSEKIDSSSKVDDTYFDPRVKPVKVHRAAPGKRNPALRPHNKKDEMLDYRQNSEEHVQHAQPTAEIPAIRQQQHTQREADDDLDTPRASPVAAKRATDQLQQTHLPQDYGLEISRTSPALHKHRDFDRHRPSEKRQRLAGPEKINAVHALCSESFLETSSQAVAALASVSWLPETQTCERHNNGSLPPIKLHDNSILDMIGVDIEFAGKNVILVKRPSAWASEQALKRLIRELVKLTSLGYSSLHVALCIDTEISPQMAKGVACFQSTALSSSECLVSFQMTTQLSLAAVIARKVLEGGAKSGEEIDPAVLMSLQTSQEQAMFLLQIAPSLTAYEAALCLQSTKERDRRVL